MQFGSYLLGRGLPGGRAPPLEVVIGAIIGALVGSIVVVVFVAWMNLIRHRPREWSVEMWHALEAGLVVAHYGAIAGAIAGVIVGYVVLGLTPRR